MTDRQKLARQFILDFEAKHGRKPGKAQLADHLHIRTSSAARLWDRLILGGHLGPTATPDAARDDLLGELKDFLAELTYLTPYDRQRREKFMSRVEAALERR
jgi:hypothetical protein